jgi:hypothetical protein
LRRVLLRALLRGRVVLAILHYCNILSQRNFGLLNLYAVSPGRVALLRWLHKFLLEGLVSLWLSSLDVESLIH